MPDDAPNAPINWTATQRPAGMTAVGVVQPALFDALSDGHLVEVYELFDRPSQWFTWRCSCGVDVVDRARYSHHSSAVDMAGYHAAGEC